MALVQMKMTREDWLKTLQLSEVRDFVETYPGDLSGCEDEVSEAFDALDRACAAERRYEEENPEPGYDTLGAFELGVGRYHTGF